MRMPASQRGQQSLTLATCLFAIGLTIAESAFPHRALAETVTLTFSGTAYQGTDYFPLFGTHDATPSYVQTIAFDTSKSKLFSYSGGYFLDNVGGSPIDTLTINQHSVHLDSSGNFTYFNVDSATKKVQFFYGSADSQSGGQEFFTSHGDIPGIFNVPFSASNLSGENSGSVTINQPGEHFYTNLLPTDVDLSFANKPKITVDVFSLLNNTAIGAGFLPTENGQPIDIAQAAMDLGFTGFNWVQTVMHNPQPATAFNPALNPLLPPFIDPPYLGYVYQFPFLPTNYPYYIEKGDLPDPSSLFLPFSDQPKHPHFSEGDYAEYLTQLVGILPGSTHEHPLFTPLNSFEWTSTYRGASGGGVNQESTSTFDDGSGVGTAKAIAWNVDVNQLPLNVRQLLVANGAQGISLGNGVPEPSVWSFLITGLFASGIALRRARFASSRRGSQQLMNIA